MRAFGMLKELSFDGVGGALVCHNNRNVSYLFKENYRSEIRDPQSSTNYTCISTSLG